MSIPRYRGPEVPCARRYSQIACVVARMWASLKRAVLGGAAVAAGAEGDPLAGVARVGDHVVVLPSRRSTSMSRSGGAGFPGERGQRHGPIRASHSDVATPRRPGAIAQLSRERER